MRVLLVHRYFWPDTAPYGLILFQISKQLVKDGHDVEVYTTQPSYMSKSEDFRQRPVDFVDGVKIVRLNMLQDNRRNILFKVINGLYFPVRVLLHILVNKSIDVIMSSTTPPIVVGLSSVVGAKLINAKYYYHCMDLHPEIGKISGEFTNPVIYNLLLKADQWTCRNAERVIVLSKNMKESLLSRPKSKGTRIDIINNFPLVGIDGDCTDDVSDEFIKEQGKFRIIFAGNLGRYQMLEAFVKSMFLIDDLPHVELVFLGEGKVLDSLKEFAGNKLDKQIRFFPHQKVNDARRIISGADLGIVSLVPDVYRYAFPSKTMTYLAEGCPLLVALEDDSELVSFVKKNEIGVAVKSGDPESIAYGIRKIASKPELSCKMRQNCLEISNEYFSQEKIFKKWSRLFSDQHVIDNK